MAEEVHPLGSEDATVVTPTIAGYLLRKFRTAIHIADPYVLNARLRLASVEGNYRLPVSLPDSYLPKTAFGEVLVGALNPEVQIRFPYNLNPDMAIAHFNSASSTGVVANGVFTMTAAAKASSFSSIKSLDNLHYHPGIGALMRGTCCFSEGVADSWQMFGFGNDEEGFNFGYDETTFGIQHRAFGSLEVRSLEITSAADAGGGDFVITLDGDAVTITVGANATISQICAAIVAAQDDFHHAGSGWHTHTDDNVSVEFISFRAIPATGTFSFVDTDSGVTAGTFNQATTTILGIAPTVNTWVPQTTWNVDKMDGAGPSGMTFNPQAFNVFQIRFQYLGTGAIEFYIEDTETGIFQLIHRIKFAGSGTVASMRNPSMPLGMIVLMGDTYSGGALAMKTASMAGFVEGNNGLIGLRHSAKGSKETTGTTPVNVLTVHSEVYWQGSINRVDVFPDTISLASETVKTVTFDIIKEPTEVGGTVALTAVEANSSVMQFDTAGTTIAGGEVLQSFQIEGAGAETFDIGRLSKIRPGERWIIAATLSSGSDAPVSVSISWRERV